MVAVWPRERSSRAGFKVAVAALILFSSAPQARLQNRFWIARRVVLGQRQERFFESRAGDFEAGEVRITQQKFANHRFSFAGMDLNRLTILLYLRHSGILAQGGDVQ